MAAAWYVVDRSISTGIALTSEGNGGEPAAARPPPSQSSETVASDELDTDTLARMVVEILAAKRDADMQERSVTIVALSCAFALLAIGFSLFVMGAEGAVMVGRESADFGRLMIMTTSPGLICILAAAFLIGVTVMGNAEAPLDADTASRVALREAETDATVREAEAKAQVVEAQANASMDLINAETEAVRQKAEAEIEALQERIFDLAAKQ